MFRISSTVSIVHGFLSVFAASPPIISSSLFRARIFCLLSRYVMTTHPHPRLTVTVYHMLYCTSHINTTRISSKRCSFGFPHFPFIYPSRFPRRSYQIHLRFPASPCIEGNPRSKRPPVHQGQSCTTIARTPQRLRSESPQAPSLPALCVRESQSRPPMYGDAIDSRPPTYI